MKKNLAELVGTFAIVLCGTGAIVLNEEGGGMVTHLGISLSFGGIVCIMIYALGNISGAHFNPAVTIALTAMRGFPVKQVLPYLISQFVGGCFASYMLKLVFPRNNLLGATLPSGSLSESFFLELLLTFILVMVILLLAFGNNNYKKYTGILVGAVVFVEAFFAGPICGASMNPIRSVAPAFVSGHIEHLWIYVFAPILGALLAVVCAAVLKSK